MNSCMVLSQISTPIGPLDLCIASTSSKNKTKLEPRASSYIIIGYAPNKKGYKLYHLRTNFVFVYKDV